MDVIVYSGITILCIIAFITNKLVRRQLAKRVHREQLMALAEPFQDHPAYHDLERQGFHFIYTLYVFAFKYPNTRMTLHFEHQPMIDDVFRAINRKYGEEGEKVYHFRLIIQNLGLPMFENASDDYAENVRLGNRIELHKDPITEN